MKSPDSGPGFAGWPDDARRLVEGAVRRHGGWALWHELRSVSCEVVDQGGPLPFVKGLHRTHPMAPRFTVYPHEGRTLLHDFPRPGHAGEFVQGDVRILDPARSLIDESRDHRRTFAGLRKNRRWDPLDALYFFGYALSTYLALPFCLARTAYVGALGAPGIDPGGGPLSGVTVDFPAGVHTHCRRQTFFFDEEGLLRRNDYTAEIVGAWARGAHFSDEYADAGGLAVATHRRVQAALFGRPTPLPVLHARFRDPRIEVRS